MDKILIGITGKSTSAFGLCKYIQLLMQMKLVMMN